MYVYFFAFILRVMNIICHIFSQVYSAVVFTAMDSGGGRMRDAKAAETERIYAAVKTFGLN